MSGIHGSNSRISEAINSWCRAVDGLRYDYPYNGTTEDAHLETAYNFDDKFSRQDVGSMAVASLLLVGEKSPKMYHMIADELAHFLPIVDSGTILGAAHVLNTMNRVAYNQIVLGFLAKH